MRNKKGFVIIHLSYQMRGYIINVYNYSSFLKVWEVAHTLLPNKKCSNKLI